MESPNLHSAKGRKRHLLCKRLMHRGTFVLPNMPFNVNSCEDIAQVELPQIEGTDCSPLLREITLAHNQRRRLLAIRTVRKMLSTVVDPRRGNTLIPVLLPLLWRYTCNCNPSALQAEALRTVAVLIPTISDYYTQKFLLNRLSFFVQHMNSSVMKVRVAALIGLATAFTVNHDMIRSGVSSRLYRHLHIMARDDRSATTQRLVAWVLALIAVESPYEVHLAMMRQTWQATRYLMVNDCRKIQENVLLTLEFVSESCINRRCIDFKEHIILMLFKMLFVDHDTLVNGSMRVLSHIMSNTEIEEHPGFILPIIECLSIILKGDNAGLTNGASALFLAIFNHNSLSTHEEFQQILPKMMTVAMHAPHPVGHTMLVYIKKSVARGSIRQYWNLMSTATVKFVLKSLFSPHVENIDLAINIVYVLLCTPIYRMTVYHYVHTFGCLGKLKGLRQHQNPEISKLASIMLWRFFDPDEVELCNVDDTTPVYKIDTTPVYLINYT